MILRCLHLGFLLAALLFQSLAIAEAPKAWGYVGWWLPDGWRSVPLGEIDRLLFIEIKVNSSGKISERNGWPEDWTDLRRAVEQHNTPLDLTLTLDDPATFDSLFSSIEATQRLLDEATSLASQTGVAGLQLDIEIYSLARPEAIKRYQSFVHELAKRLHQYSPARNLSIFFPIGGESQLYDATTLQQLDQVVLQGYDAHWPSSKTAGPVAPLTGDEAISWRKAVTLGTALGIPKERLLLGFPLFGYEWQVKGSKLHSATVGKGVSTTFGPVAPGLLPEMQFNVQDRVEQYGASHDPLTGSSYYQFKREDGQFIEGWFEDWWSLRRKSDYLADEKLGGIAFFLLGYDGGQLVDYFLKRRGPRSREDIANRVRKILDAAPETGRRN